MTVFLETDHRVVLQMHDQAAPGQPAIALDLLNGPVTDVLTASPGRKRTFWFFDPNNIVSTPPDPTHSGTIFSQHDYRIVRRVHDGAAPTAPSLTDMFLRQSTVVLSASPDRKLTIYIYDPEQVQGADSFLLLENGDRFLLESGDRLILE